MFSLLHTLPQNNSGAGALYGYTYKQNATTMILSGNSVGMKQNSQLATHVRTSQLKGAVLY